MNNLTSKMVMLGIVFLTGLIYLHGLNGPFLFDDFSNTLQITINNLKADALIEAAFSNSSGLFRRPIPNLSFALTHHFFDANPFAFKLFNLIVHLLCGYLVYLCTRYVLRSANLSQQRLNHSSITAISTITCFIWLLHPLQVSTVLYVVQRMAQLSTLFSLLAIIVFLRWRLALAQGQHQYGFYLLFPISCLLAILSKESAVLIPLLIGVCELCLFQFAAPEQRRKTLSLVLGLTVGLPLVLGVAGMLYLWNDLMAGYATRTFTLSERLLTEVHALGHYLKLLILPRISEMGLYYDDFPITRNLSLITVIWISVFIASLVISWIYRKRYPLITFGIFWFFASHALESTFLPLEPVFEHRNYLASIGLFIVLAQLLWIGFERIPKRAVSWLLLGLASLLLVFSTWQRVDIWSSYAKFASNQSIFHENSARAQYDLINFAVANGDMQQANARVDVIEQLRPNDPSTTLIRLKTLCSSTISDTDYDRAIHAMKNFRETRETLGFAKNWVSAILQGKCPAADANRVLEVLGAGLENPQFAPNGKLRWALFLLRGRLLLAAQLDDLAYREFMQAAAIDPKEPQGYFDLAYYYLNNTQLNNADRMIQKIEEIASRTLLFSNFRLKELKQQRDLAYADQQSKS